MENSRFDRGYLRVLIFYGLCYKRIRKHFFLCERLGESLGELEIAWKHSPFGFVFPLQFLVLPNFHSCFYNCMETRKIDDVTACKEQKSTTRDEVEWRDCCSLHAVTSSVIYYSTVHTRKNVIYLFYTIKIRMVYWRICYCINPDISSQWMDIRTKVKQCICEKMVLWLNCKHHAR